MTTLRCLVLDDVLDETLTRFRTFIREYQPGTLIPSLGVIVAADGDPGGAVDRVTSTQEGGLFRCPGAAFLQRCPCDNGSEFGEDLRVVAFEITAEPGIADQPRKVARGDHQIEHGIPIGRRNRFELAR